MKLATPTTTPISAAMLTAGVEAASRQLDWRYTDRTYDEGPALEPLARAIYEAMEAARRRGKRNAGV